MKCLFDLEKDCHSKDCIDCTLGDIKSEINTLIIIGQSECVSKKEVLKIIDKYMRGKEDQWTGKKQLNG
jgi:hypothetical protein